MAEMDEWDEETRLSVSKRKQSSYAGTMQSQQISTVPRTRDREKIRRRRIRTILVKC